MTKINAREDACPYPTDRTPTPHESPSADAVRTDSAQESSDDESAALEKVRELLFGEQARTTDKRLQEVERRSIAEITRRTQEISERMGNLGQDLGARLGKLADQIAKLEAAMHENNEQISQRTEELRDELTERMTEDTGVLERRITENHENAVAHVEQAAGILQDAKMSRQALAALLSEMASRVGGK